MTGNLLSDRNKVLLAFFAKPRALNKKELS